LTPQATTDSFGAVESTDLAGAPETEISPEAIRAGAEVIWRCFDEAIPFGSSFGELVAVQVFSAMNEKLGSK
jgi:hypothetical protein